MSAIYILWLREIKRYTRSRAQIIASLGQPLLYLLALGFGLGPVFQKAGYGSYLQFVAPGVIGMSVLFTSIFSGIGLLWDRQFGFLKETLVAPVPRLHIMIGRTLGGATIAIIQGLLVIIICVLVGFRSTHASTIPLGILFMVLISLVFAALGTIIGSRLQNMQGFQLIMNFLVLRRDRCGSARRRRRHIHGARRAIVREHSSLKHLRVAPEKRAIRFRRIDVAQHARIVDVDVDDRLLVRAQHRLRARRGIRAAQLSKNRT